MWNFFQQSGDSSGNMAVVWRKTAEFHLNSGDYRYYIVDTRGFWCIYIHSEIHTLPCPGWKISADMIFKSGCDYEKGSKRENLSFKSVKLIKNWRNRERCVRSKYEKTVQCRRKYDFRSGRGLYFGPKTIFITPPP
jgi:hypothetical protein